MTATEVTGQTSQYDLQKNSEVLLRIAMECEQSGLYREENGDLERWLNP